MHIPVLLTDFLLLFKEKKLRFFIDGTVGAGGHAKALLENHPEIEIFYGLDRDPSALLKAQTTLRPFQEKISLIHGNYRAMDELIPQKEVDGIFLDLGVSSMQLDEPERGFSVYHEGPLDMRMDPSSELDAQTVVNTFSEEALGEIFRDLGEERRWRAVAKAIVAARKKKRLKTTTDLAEALKHVLTWGGRGRKKIHPLTLVFQALRIYVNDELKGLDEGVNKAISLLAPGGRLAIISFHSLEDRIVKHLFLRAKTLNSAEVITKKPIQASFVEKRVNPRSRSAKLRCLEKKVEDI